MNRSLSLRKISLGIALQDITSYSGRFWMYFWEAYFMEILFPRKEDYILM